MPYRKLFRTVTIFTDTYTPTDRTTVRRHADRGAYERELVHEILDEALSCNLGFAVDGQPYVIPTIHARVGETLYLHGAPAGRMLETLAGGARCCLTVTLVDGIVLARSALHHSLNYRSVVVFGSAREVLDPEEKEVALRAVVEHIVPGRSAEARPPSEKELKATRVLVLPLGEASAKVRSGGPVDSRGDLELPVWAGVLPLRLTPQPLVPDAELAPELRPPPYIEHWRRGADA